MNTQAEIKEYIASLPKAKSSEMEELHKLILEIMPDCKLWYLDGKNEQGKVVSNPNIGYGTQLIKAASGVKSKDSTREFYQVGISANTSGISIYIIGLEDKTYLANTYANKIGKANVTGYCIKFKTLKDINLEILKDAIRFGFKIREENEN
jgi:hypothetical protein